VYCIRLAADVRDQTFTGQAVLKLSQECLVGMRVHSELLSYQITVTADSILMFFQYANRYSTDASVYYSELRCKRLNIKKNEVIQSVIYGIETG